MDEEEQAVHRSGEQKTKKKNEKEDYGCTAAILQQA